MGEGDHKKGFPYGRGGSYNEMHSTSLSISPYNEETAITDLTNQGSSITKKLEPDSVAIRVSLEVNKGEYNLKLKSVPTDNAMAEHAHTAAVLISQGDLLRQLGLKLLSKL